MCLVSVQPSVYVIISVQERVLYEMMQMSELLPVKVMVKMMSYNWYWGIKGTVYPQIQKIYIHIPTCIAIYPSKLW